MEYDEVKSLSREMAIKVIVHDLNEIMVPTDEARPRAIACLDHGDQQALTVEYRMFGALVALDGLGYDVVKREAT